MKISTVVRIAIVENIGKSEMILLVNTKTVEYRIISGLNAKKAKLKYKHRY